MDLEQQRQARTTELAALVAAPLRVVTYIRFWCLVDEAFWSMMVRMLVGKSRRNVLHAHARAPRVQALWGLVLLFFSLDVRVARLRRLA